MKIKTKKNCNIFNINKLSNLWCKSFIKRVKVPKKALLTKFKFSKIKQSFYGIFLEVLLTKNKLNFNYSKNQQRLTIFENNYLFLINFNFYIKNQKYFVFFKKKVINLLYSLKNNNKFNREYYKYNSLNKFFYCFKQEKALNRPNIVALYSTSWDYWHLNFSKLRYYNKLNPIKVLALKFKFNKQNITKNIFYLLNIYPDYFLVTALDTITQRVHKVSKKNIHDTIKFQNFEKSNQNTYFLQRPINFPLQWIQKGDLLADCSASNNGEIALGKNLLVAYMPWEGFNFEDAVLINETVLSKYTSLHIAKYDLEISETSNSLEKITSNIPGFSKDELQKLDKNGIIKIGSWVQEGDILVGKIITTIPQPLLTHEKLLYDIMGQKTSQIEEKCLRVPLGVSGRIIRISYVYSKIQKKISKSILKKISIYIMEKRVFQIGDKISGRHGNKGIISKVFSTYDMPYLPNGSSLDVILNPLGVPSRMNVGQILECLLGFAGKIFYTKFQVLCFDEIHGYEASRSYIYSKLFEACKKTQQKWIFSKKNPGKLHLFDGRNGSIFHQSVMVGVTYLMKLIHIVDEKIHARATGPYSLITQQPLRGRAKHGGQRIGEMEVWALQGFGCAYTLQELLTIKSDDLHGRKQIMQALLKNTPLKFGTPESFRVVLRELQCLCLDLQLSF